jgi:predicted metalloprotease
MQWRGRRTSDNIEDRRRAGPMRTGGIGVIGLLIVLAVGLIFGVDITPLFQGGGGMVQSPAPSGPNVIEDESEEFVGVVLAETEDVWRAIFQESGYQYPEPRLVLYAGGTVSACGAAQSAMGPFYCPNDKTVYLDTDFFRTMSQQLGARGEFARAYVIAHEVGHHVQNELGVLGQVNAQRARMSQADGNALSVMVELQADCYSGIWARAAADRLALTEQDIRDALDTAARIGDDALQRASRGRVVPDSFTHGTSEQRQRWFYEGLRSGDPATCDTFNATDL